MFGAGTVAGLAVDWYNVSSFEGGAGFFVVGMALVGLIAGFLIGLVGESAPPRAIRWRREIRSALRTVEGKETYRR